MRSVRALRAARRCVAMVAVLMASVGMAACTPIRLVADYQQASLDETLRLSKQVDLFYLALLESTERPYAPYAERYIAIEAEMGGWVRRERARPLNSESVRISEITLGFWRAYKEKHRAANAYRDARFDRRRFERLFDAAVSAEAAKRLARGDTDAPVADTTSQER